MVANLEHLEIHTMMGYEFISSVKFVDKKLYFCWLRQKLVLLFREVATEAIYSGGYTDIQYSNSSSCRVRENESHRFLLTNLKKMQGDI